MCVDIETVRKARAYASRYFRRHRDDRRGHSSHLASEAITNAGKRFGIGFGCEAFCWDCGREGISYLNMGDTYDATVLFDSRNERFTVGCWGDVVERLERQGVTLD